MTASAPQPDQDQPRFALSIGGKVYGPYASQQIRSYIAEGRVTGHSLISRDGGPWMAAADEPFCAHVLSQRAKRAPETPPPADIVDVSTPAAEPARTPQSTANAREAFLKELEGVRGLRPASKPARAGGPPRPGSPAPAPSPAFGTAREDATDIANFAIIFDLKSRGHNKLEEEIMSLGHAVRVLPGFWLVSAATTSGAIRNRLTKFFGTMDTFFIVDASRDKLAWFNLGPEIDAHIRQVWRRS